MNDTPDASHKHNLLQTLTQRLRGLCQRKIKSLPALRELLKSAKQQGLIDIDALQMLDGVLDVSEMQARDIMIPRAQMVTVDKDAAPEHFLPTIIQSGHSRFPVIGEDKDDVLGILLAKDLLNYFGKGEPNFNIRNFLRPAVFVPESKRVNVLLKDFRANRNHMAMVVDEYGGIAGIITMEDILEEIVGEIADEYDIEPQTTYIQRLNKLQFNVNALTDIEDFNAAFDAHLSDEEFDTIGGLVTQGLGHLPDIGESITIEGYKFTVVNADDRKITLLKMTCQTAPNFKAPS